MASTKDRALTYYNSMDGDNQRCVTAVRQFLEGVYGGTWESRQENVIRMF